MHHKRHNKHTVKFLNETDNYRALARNCTMLGLSVFSMKMACGAMSFYVPSESPSSVGLLTGVGTNIAVACFETNGQKLKHMLKHPSDVINPQLFILAYLAPIAFFQALHSSDVKCSMELQLFASAIFAYTYCSIGGLKR